MTTPPTTPPAAPPAPAAAAPAAAPAPGPNDPDSRDHGDRVSMLADHEKNKGADRPCFWKHPYGKSKSDQIRISMDEADTHACHYRKNGIEQAESVPNLYNTRDGRANNQEVAIKLGYLKLGADSSGALSARVQRDTEEYRTTAVAIAADKSRTTSTDPVKIAEAVKKGQTFLEAYRARYVKSLYWLLRDPHGWDVGYRASLDPRHLRKIHGATKDNKPANKQSAYTKLMGDLGGRAPKNFAIKESQADPGLGKWYPYEHDHHHILPASTFQEHVLNGPSEEPICNYMTRAAVVMKGTWNIHHQNNMILLPNETYPARILNLPAHIPWQMGADHPPYSRTFEQSLETIRSIIDKALMQERKGRHDAVDKAAAKISTLLNQLSATARENILRGRFFILEPR